MLFILFFLLRLNLNAAQLRGAVTDTYQANTKGRHYYQWNNTRFEAIYIDLPSDSPSLLSQFHDVSKRKVNETLRTNSQVKQDLIVYSILKKDHGFFVDLAANDWKDGSNTYALEDAKIWSGICIEPNSEYIFGLLANRRCKVIKNPVSAYSNENENVKFRLKGQIGGIVGDSFDQKNEEEDIKGGKLAPVIVLQTTTLLSILDHFEAPLVIDYLSLDVEGAESFVLKHFDFGKYLFRVLTIERPDLETHKLLHHHGYYFLAALGDFGDCMYLHKSLSNFVEVMNEYRLPFETHHPSWNVITFIDKKPWIVVSQKMADFLVIPPWTGHIDT